MTRTCLSPEELAAAERVLLCAFMTWTISMLKQGCYGRLADLLDLWEEPANQGLLDELLERRGVTPEMQRAWQTGYQDLTAA